MVTALRTRSLIALAGLATAGGLLATPASAATEPCSPSGPGMIVDARATDGIRNAEAPPKYEYGNSPYIGARYHTCLRTLNVYYGGYEGVSYYVIRSSDGHERKVTPHVRGVWTPKTDELYQKHFGLTVKACKRSATSTAVSCTRWSPTVWLIP